MKNTMLTLVLVVVVALGGAALFVYSGRYNVAVTEPHAPATRSVFNTVVKNSVRAHAAGIVPPPLTSPQMIKSGAEHFSEYCAGCHGALGTKRGEFGLGLMPPPPVLSEEAGEWTPAELFWIVKHGIKMTGMPAWGSTHDNTMLWSIVAFLGQMPQMSAQQYQSLTASADEHQH